MQNMNLYYLIESGPALAAVKAYIADRLRVREVARALAKELGVEEMNVDRFNGVLRGVKFTGAVHPDFKVPNRAGISFPKRGSDWERRIFAQVGYESGSAIISRLFKIPLHVSFKTRDGSGGSCIGTPLAECGFLYPSQDGPFAMYVPDVPKWIDRIKESDRATRIISPAKIPSMRFTGCRRIEPEEWDIIVAQHELAVKKKAKRRKNG